MTVHVTIELTEEQKARLDAEAERRQITLSELLVQSAARIDDPWVIAVEEARADVAAGYVLDHEDVVERASQRREELLAAARAQ